MLESTAPKIISAPKKYIKIILLSYFTEVVTFVKSLKKYFIPFFLFIFLFESCSTISFIINLFISSLNPLTEKVCNVVLQFGKTSFPNLIGDHFLFHSRTISGSMGDPFGAKSKSFCKCREHHSRPKLLWVTYKNPLHA